MNAITVFNVVALAGASISLVSVLTIPTGASSKFDATPKAILAFVMLLFCFIGFSNVLEHAGITDTLDALEDFAEVMLFPLLAYVAYSMDTSEQLDAAANIQSGLQHERDLISTLVDMSPAATVLIDGDGLIRFAGASAIGLLGPDVVVGASARDIRLKPHGMTGGSDGPAQTMADIAAHAPFRDELYTIEGGAERIVSASAEMIDAGELPDTVLVFLDVSERLRVDKELAAYRRDLETQVELRTEQLTVVNTKLESQNLAKQEFLSKMSHELRTPLNSIIGFTGILLRGMAGELSKEQETQLSMIERSGRRLLSLVNDVLDITKIDAGQAAVSLRPAQIHALVASLVAEMRALADERGISLEYENESARPEVRTDPDKIEQIVRNLVSNGLKYTPEHGAVSLVVSDVPEGVAVTVSDTGKGMSAEEKAQVFEPFYQGKANGGEVLSGTGLGLSIARELADLIGASISVSSAPGEGSSFKLIIPE